MRTFHVPDRCPSCDTDLGACTAVIGGETGPGPGDVSVCWGCAEVLEFGEDLRVRVARPDHPARADDMLVLLRYRVQTEIWRR